jgi:hypothetical protein
MEDEIDDFELWCGLYRDEPSMAPAETMRLLLVMCQTGNRFALDYLGGLRSGRELLPSDSTHDLFDALWRDVAILESKEPFSLDDLDGEQWGILIGTLDVRAPGAEQSLAEPNTNVYPPNWSEVATARKDERSWCCGRCAYQSWYSGLIQVHHVDGDKTNNLRSNLEVLCAICHGQKHGTVGLWPMGATASEISDLELHHRRWSLAQLQKKRSARKA